MSETSGRRDFLNPLKAIKAFREESVDSPIEVPHSGIDENHDFDENSLIVVSKDAMACNFQIYFRPDVDDESVETAIEALELVEQLENQMTVYRSSPLTYLNDTAVTEPIRAERRLFDLIRNGIELFEKTEGAFDMTAGLLTKAWGFFRKQGRVPSATEISEVLASVGSDKIKIDPDSETVFFDGLEMEINLGAIGKGHALDRVAEFMTDSGLEHFLIHGGQSSVLSRGVRWRSATNQSSTAGDSKAGGSKSVQDDPWKVGLRHPLHAEKRIAEIVLQDRALGTSGTGRQSFYHKGKRYGHIIDPRTGQPSEGVFSATAIAETAAEADALATAFYVMGGPASVEFCKNHPEYSCLILTPSRTGDVEVHSQGLKDSDVRFL